MDTREADAGDVERIIDIVEVAMRNSYRLSPQQIEVIIQEEFGEDRLREKMDDSETTVLVTETSEDVEGEMVAGVVEGRLDDSIGEVAWLFVDSRLRGQGIGTELFEAVADSLRDQGADHIKGTILEANTEGHQFIERMGLEQKSEEHVEIGEETLVNYVYADASFDVEPDSGASAEQDDDEWPQAEMHGDEVTASADGEQVYVDPDEEHSGTEASFFTAYVDDEETDQFGYYCSNCGSLDTTMDNMNRIECNNCGNTHKQRGSEEYDDSYL